MAGFLERVKQERTLTFNHWRYRLLHWTLNVSPSNAEESPLPHFLYSHYCPLFHLTNLFFLAAPFVGVWKGIVKPTTGVLWSWALKPLLMIPYLGCLWFIEVLNVDLKMPKLTREKTQEEIEMEEFLVRLNWCLLNEERYLDFEYCWKTLGYRMDFGNISKEDLLEIHTHMIAKIELAKEKARLRNARFVKWVNFGRQLTKVLTFVGALGGLIGGSFLLYFGIPWLITQISALFSWGGGLPWRQIFAVVGYMIGAIVGILVASFTWASFKLGTKLSDGADLAGQGFSKTIDVVWPVIVWPFAVMVRMASTSIDFVCELYENSCPPIKIIDDTKEVLFTKYIDGVMDYLTGDNDSKTHQFLRVVESNVGEGIPEQGADDFRRTLAAFVGALATRDQEFTLDSHPTLRQAILKTERQQKGCVDAFSKTSTTSVLS